MKNHDGFTSPIRYKPKALEARWRFPHGWDAFLAYWRIDPSTMIQLYNGDHDGPLIQAREIPKYKTEHHVLTFDVLTPNALLGFFLPSLCREFGISVRAEDPRERMLRPRAGVQGMTL